MRFTLITLLFALPAVAQDELLSKRYHDAYVLEVIEGKPAEAARSYLELLDAPKLPDRLRRQTEFRFAVTCVLLGRSDEARARLAALAAVEGLPKDLRAQVDEYRKAIEDVKLGTALETNLQALTMKLALSYSGGARRRGQLVYREFEVLGPRTIPYVRQLLQHEDRDLSWHAFQILARMGVPDLLELWDPARHGGGFALAEFAKRNPEQIAQLEATLRKLPKGQRKGELERLRHAVVFSMEFIRWVADQPGLELAAAGMLAGRSDRVESEKLVLEWMRNGRPALQVTAAQYYGYWLARKETKKPADMFIVYCLLRKPDYSGGQVGTYASHVPAAVRLQALTAVLDAAEADPKFAAKALVDGLAVALADSIDPEVGKSVDARAYLSILQRWEKQIRGTDNWSDWSPLPIMTFLRTVIVALPEADGQRIVEQSQKLFGSEPIQPLLGFERAEDVALIRTVLAGMIATSDSSRDVPQTVARSVENPKATSEYLRAVAQLWPTLSPWMGGPFSYPHFFQTLATRIPEGEARAALMATAVAVANKKDGNRFTTLTRLFPATNRNVEEPGRTYASRVLFPLLPALFAKLPTDASSTLAYRAAEYVHRTRAVKSLQAERERVAAALLVALPKMGWSFGQWQWLASSPELFPLESWVRAASFQTWRIVKFKLEAADVERAAKTFAKDPSRINDSVAMMLAQMLRGKSRTPIAEEIGRKADASVLQLMVGSGLPPSYPLLEKRLLEFNEDPEVGERTLLALAKPLVLYTPSPRLFPVVKRLLRSDQPGTAMSAMDLATSLGSEELIANIAPALDSMNARVREKAKASIESILDSRRIKAEIAARLGK